MKNSGQLYRKFIVLMVIFGITLCFVSAAQAGQKPLITENKPFVGTQTDVWIDWFHVVNNKNRCVIYSETSAPAYEGECDIFDEDEISFSGRMKFLKQMKLTIPKVSR
jgi:hypothetical protein